MHIVTGSNYFDLNKTVALRTVAQQKRFSQFSHKFSSNLSISLVQNISVLDKSRKLSPVLELIMKIKHKCFLAHQFNSL